MFFGNPDEETTNVIHYQIVRNGRHDNVVTEFELFFKNHLTNQDTFTAEILKPRLIINYF